MTVSLQEVSEALLRAALKAGADAADVMAVSEQAVSVTVRGGRLEQAERADAADIGLRVLVGQRQACVSASDSRPEILTEMAARAVAMARAAPEDPTVGLADPGQLATDTDSTALDLAEPGAPPPPERLRDWAVAAEAAALGVTGITQVQAAEGYSAERQVRLAASNGFSAGYARTERGLSCVAIAGTGTGMERDHYGDRRVHAGDLDDPEAVGRRAGLRAAGRLGARKPPTGRYPVLFDERLSSSLIGHLLAAANGRAVARGTSWLRDALGTQILPATLTLTEDPTRPRAFGSRAFDAEGLPTRQRRIVENGRLCGWTLDLAHARQLGLTSTGNAQRGLSAPPSPGNWNIALTQGTASADDLRRDMGTGLWITGLIGATINPSTGDYSRGASGFWVENGEIIHPVNECTIAGNLREMLATLVPGNDARPHLSHVVPSLLVEGVTIAGT